MSSLTQAKDPAFLKILRAPIMLLGMVLGAVVLIFVVATTTTGQIWEEVLVSLGFRFKREWLIVLLGIVTYFLLFVAFPVFVGFWFFGLVGAILLPLGILAIMAMLDRW